MNTEYKINIIKKIYCLGEDDIRAILGKEDYDSFWKYKYDEARKTFGSYGNFHILFQLDSEDAEKFLTYAGFKNKGEYHEG